MFWFSVVIPLFHCFAKQVSRYVYLDSRYFQSVTSPGVCIEGNRRSVDSHKKLK